MLAHSNSSFFTKLILILAAIVGVLFLTPSLSAVLPNGEVLAPAPLSVQNGMLAFVAEEEGMKDLYIMNLDGTGLLRLTTTRAQESAPMWGPAGQTIAFESGRDIYRITLGESRSRFFLNRIGQSKGMQDLKWSRDGSKVLFHLQCENTPANTLYVMNADSSDPRCLDIGGLTLISSAWSPDSTRIVFTASADASGSTDIYIINADGSGLYQLTSDADREVSPQWSPDGTQIYYMAYHPGLNPSALSLYRRNLDGSHVRAFIREPESGCSHAPHAAPPDEEQLWSISPDGQSALVTTRQGQTYTLVVVDLHTFMPIMSLTSEGHAYWDLIWSPDGQFVVYRLAGVYSMMNVVTHETQRLNFPLENVSGVAWQPVWK